MGKTIKFDISKSLAMNFAVFENDLKKIAENHGIPVTEAIDQFVLDLENYGKEGYTKKIDEITLGGLTPSILAGLISYMNKMKKAYERKEQNDKRRKKQEERKKSKDSDKKEFEEKINNLISEQKAGTQLDAMKMILKDINNGNYVFDTTKEKRKIIREIEKRIELEEEKEKRIVEENAQKEAQEQARQAEIQRKAEEEKERQEEIQRKADEAWQSIQGVAKREIKKRNIKESQYWIAIRKKFVEQAEGREDEDVKKQILKLIDDTIIEKEDNEYFEEVKLITRDFKELANFSVEMMNGIYGTSARKMTTQNMDRFLNLRFELQKTNNEYQQIRRLLSNKFTTEGDKRILLARKDVMDKEFEKKRIEEGR